MCFLPRKRRLLASFTAESTVFDCLLFPYYFVVTGKTTKTTNTIPRKFSCFSHDDRSFRVVFVATGKKNDHKKKFLKSSGPSHDDPSVVRNDEIVFVNPFEVDLKRPTGKLSISARWIVMNILSYSTSIRHSSVSLLYFRYQLPPPGSCRLEVSHG